MVEKSYRPKTGLINGPILTFVPAKRKHYKDLNSMSEGDIKSLFAELEKEQIENTLWGCRACGSVHKVKDSTIIQTHRYVSPYSCAGGDYWVASERQLECSECGIRNRIISDEHIPSPSYFKDIVITHER